MDSRRVFLKKGLGLAGIIAAGEAPASIVKSMIGMHNAMMDGKQLPYKRRLQWLQFNATDDSLIGCYIDTGIVPNGNQDFSIVFSDFTSRGRWLCGSRIAYANNAFGFYTAANSLNFEATYGNVVLNNSPEFSAFATTNVGQVTFRLDANILSASQELGSQTYGFTFMPQTISSWNNLVIGGLNNNGSIISFSVFKFYRATISGLRDYIPVIDWNDVACIYDQITGQLVYNQGTGSFIIGPDK